MNAKTVIFGVLMWMATVCAQENYAQWQNYRSITIGGANSIISGTVYNFPLLVRLSSSNFDFSKAAANGSDIRFAKLNGTTHLPYQIERWDTASHSASVWVLVDTIMPASTGAVFRMYYGKSGTADSSRGDLVFSTTNNFQGVFHLGEATNDTARDATSNRFKGVPRNRGGANPADFAGVIGRAKNFMGRNTNINGGSYQILTSSVNHTYEANPLNFQNDSATFNDIPQYTISTWIYLDTVPISTSTIKGIVAKSGGLNGRQYHLRLRDPATHAFDITQDTNRMEFNDGVQAVYKSGTHRLLTGSWYHVVAVRSGTVGDSTHLMIYVDGGNIFRGSASLTMTTRSDYDVYIGSFSNDSGYFCGKIDEVEFSNVARDSNWIKLSYQTQKPGANLVVFGIVDSAPPPPTFAYRTSPLILITGTAMIPDTPFVTVGTAAGWSVNPGLPAGLTFNTARGIISGTPTATQAAANYTVTANGAGGTGQAILSITVNPFTSIATKASEAFAVKIPGRSSLMFQLSKGIHSVELSIMDLHGRTVWTQTAGNGMRELTWNGVTNGGHPTSPGIYVVRVAMLDMNGKTTRVIEKRISYLP